MKHKSKSILKLIIKLKKYFKVFSIKIHFMTTFIQENKNCKLDYFNMLAPASM
jgi:hypothetical protein